MALLNIPYGKGYIEKEVDFPFEKVNISEEKLPHTNEQEILRALNEPIGKSLEGLKNQKKYAL